MFSHPGAAFPALQNSLLAETLSQAEDEEWRLLLSPLIQVRDGSSGLGRGGKALFAQNNRGYSGLCLADAETDLGQAHPHSAILCP